MPKPKHPYPTGKGSAGQAQRAPIEQEMELKFPNFELLVTAISANISTTGMFIQTSEPTSIGTTLAFRFRIEDWSPIQGTARVVWIRPEEEASDRPAGIGVKFVDLDAQSRRMIRYLIDKHLQTGGEPFELGPAADADSGLEPAGSASAPGPPAGEARGHRRLWAVGGGLMLAVVAFGLWFQLGRPSAGHEQPPPRMEGAQTSVVGPNAAPAPAESSEAATPTDHRPAKEAIEQLVRDWSAAWEGRQIEALLSLYAPDFEPPGRQSRAQWEAGLRQEIENASFLRVAISGLEIAADSAYQGRATFYQSVRSDRRDETVRTSFEVVQLDDGWKIARQTLSR